ncbi:NADH-quinone oxidoreductase subunit C [Carboxydothermus ferrireducens]|uniref:NAD(P)H dehydrogenase subunit J n=1 Tax=Carboxydothermus ferrireducens DSM 11255 TaxID=1119529 RepID=A0ABX2RC70_9THEO|nr:NADH-quinone oxidoreductase subunit C [Carboxydothermus ferrireducens]NYE58192.1 NADH-quinone oxidoreductase subunit C [Carboxydothermus ferrireducens DSM 11255]
MNVNEVYDRLHGKYDVELNNDAIIVKNKDEILNVLREIKDMGFELLTNLTAVDYPPERFEIVYHVESFLNNYDIITVKTSVNRENPRIPSAFSIWPAADWQEREVYDLMGIVFENHPHLTRVFLGEDFEGFPLRKDYKVQSNR